MKNLFWKCNNVIVPKIFLISTQAALYYDNDIDTYSMCHEEIIDWSFC